MKKFITHILLILSTLHVYSQQMKLRTFQPFYSDTSVTVCDTSLWMLMFEDNFDTDTLDLSKWELQRWAQGALYGNNGASQEYNTLDNVVIENGVLKIVAKKEKSMRKAMRWQTDSTILADGLPNKREYDYTSSNIWTKQKFQYGKMEARIKIPKGKGLWPAFWLYGDKPSYSELDIFEVWNEYDNINKFNPKKLSKVLHFNVHFDHDGSGHVVQHPSEYYDADFADDFHVYTLVWDEDKIEWYIDGFLKRLDFKYFHNKKRHVEDSLVKGEKYLLNTAFPTHAMAIILNLAVQTGKDEPDSTTTLPKSMDIDWIRYYQRSEEAKKTIYIPEKQGLDYDEYFEQPLVRLKNEKLEIYFGRNYKNHNVVIIDKHNNIIQKHTDIDEVEMAIAFPRKWQRKYSVYILNLKTNKVMIFTTPSF